MMTIAEQWVQEGLEKGLERGRQEGLRSERQLLRRWCRSGLSRR